MDTKSCRHCRQLIPFDARLCHHCHGYQTWWANQGDPRFALTWIAVIGAFLVSFLLLMRNETRIDEVRVDPPKLTVSETTSHFVPTTDGARAYAYVLGHVRNNSSIDATRIWFRVNFLDSAGRVVDSFLLENSGLVVPANGSATFRLVNSLGVAPSEIKNTQVVVERSVARARWDSM